MTASNAHPTQTIRYEYTLHRVYRYILDEADRVVDLEAFTRSPADPPPDTTAVRHIDVADVDPAPLRLTASRAPQRHTHPAASPTHITA